MSMDERRLAELCARHGVLTDYHDVWGHRHAPSAAALWSLLAELGVQDVEGVGQQPPRAPALHAIPAGSAGWSIPVQAGPGEVSWRVVEEGGREHRGTAASHEPGTPLQMNLPLPAGYHRFMLEHAAAHHGEDEAGTGTGTATATTPATTCLIAAPPHCHRPALLQGDARTWGPSVQLYALRSHRNWGMGDFTDLAALVALWARLGAGLVGLNPLHAMFSHNPRHASPYSPSSRLQLNTLYLDVEAVPELQGCTAARELLATPQFGERLQALRAADLVDYAGVAAAKAQVLHLLYRQFRSEHLHGDGSARGQAFRRFQAQQGAALRLHATCEALQAHLHAQDASVWGWPVWPEALRRPEAPGVARFVAEHLEAVEHHEYLQWLAHDQLDAVNRRCRALGMPVGLYLDLAVSVDRAGADVWGHQQAYAAGATVGAPPDEVNPNGQGWGLPPLRPDALARQLDLFIGALRAAMRHAGAVRIDHVMGLMRLYWIPPGSSPRDGSYVLYPLRELMAVVALESERHRCMVIGEDLGTVPDEMRAAMQQHEMLSYRLLYFEREHGGAFKPPEAYPRHALVAVSTHDLPTLAGWWQGHDIEVRRQLHLYPEPHMAEQQREQRAHDRLRLLTALRQAGLLPDDSHVDASGTQPITPELAAAVHAFVARAPSWLMVLQLEDALGVADQPNLPGTVQEHPNWQRKLPLALEDMAHDPRITGMAARVAAERPLPHARTPEQGAVIPRATYRLQLHRDFGFDQALALLPYLARLGISHVYCSPISRARPGSLHGYDVVAHGEINPELGGEQGFQRFTAGLRAHGMGQVLDLVPNHMGVLGADNPWWTDVLEHGPSSPYARHFDIDWHPVNADLEGKVLVPVLGEHYGDALADGSLRLAFEPAAGALVLRYHEHRFPLRPRSYPLVLTWAAQRLGDGHARGEVESLAETLATLPTRGTPDPARTRAMQQVKARLAALALGHAEVAAAVHAAVDAFNADETRDTLHALHEAQNYRLAYWRVAADEINYRRFFDINELAALRMEEPAVFEATHGWALDLAAQGLVDGLRIDHPDGLHDPAQYFQRLQQGYAQRAGIELPAPTPPTRPPRPLYVVAEKIAAPHEDVPEEWAVHGTTGYRFAMVAGGVLVDTTAAERFERIWQRHSGERESFAELAYRGKLNVARTALACELTVLATALMRIARADRRTRDYTFNALRDALAQVAACMPVYRTYILGHASAQDLRYLDWAIAHARRRSDAADLSVFEFISRVLRGQGPDGQAVPAEHAAWQFAARFQQFCAPVAAKGVEDTAFYQYHRLVSLNEVGGDPGPFGVSVRAFHGASSDRAARWPHTILATSTHDNKRSEDVRNRISVLSEMPGAWRLGLARWKRLARNLRSEVHGMSAPSGADEYLLYQTLLGTLPAAGLHDDELAAYRERIEHYMLKAAREAKRHTRWTCPDEAYEAALTAFVHGVLARVQPNPLLSDLQASATALAWYGALNSLTLVLLKFTSPGVPDLYQGNELLDLSLVDPDNRRPVDYALRLRLLDELETWAAQPEAARLQALHQMATAPHDGRAKLWFTWRLLQLRTLQPELLREGRYLALVAHGPQQEHVLSYARVLGNTALVVVACRLPARLAGARLGGEVGRLPVGEAAWSDTRIELPPGVPDGCVAHDVLSGQRLAVEGSGIEVARAFAHLPGAALLLSW